MYTLSQGTWSLLSNGWEMLKIWPQSVHVSEVLCVRYFSIKRPQMENHVPVSANWNTKLFTLQINLAHLSYSGNKVLESGGGPKHLYHMV
jgi:hypothetical protein